jgi:hypothetical protein
MMRGCIDIIVDCMSSEGKIFTEKDGYIMGGTLYGMKIHLSIEVCGWSECMVSDVLLEPGSQVESP